MRFVSTLITGVIAGALAGGGLFLFSAWLYLPTRTYIAPKAEWTLFATLMGASYGAGLGLIISLVSGLTHAGRPAAALIGFATGGVVSVRILISGAAWEQQPRLWMIMAPLLGALVGLCASAVGSYRP